MLMSSFAALAEGGTTTPTNNLTADTTISISGLDENDSVNFYQVLKFDQDAVTTGGWVATTGFADLTEAEIQQILGITLQGSNYIQTDGTVAGAYGITEDRAVRMANLAKAYAASTPAQNSTTTVYPNVVATTADGNNGYKAEQASPEPGLYVAIIHPAKAGTVYNPVFVGADYKQGTQTSNTFTVVAMEDSYSPAATAKKETITLNKDSKDTTTHDDNSKETVRVGDTLTFTVQTTIPEFAANYTNPAFFLTDILSTGLQLVSGSITVYADANHAISADTATDTAPYVTLPSGVSELAKTSGSTTNYSVNENKNKANEAINGYSVVFSSQFLKDMVDEQPITIVYRATVTSEAPASVNKVDNTVTLNYSNYPTDEEGHGILKDETKHYTFDIDGQLLGESTWETTELVKIGLDKDGKELTQKKTLHGGQEVGALQGAQFKLYVLGSGTGSATIKNEAGTEISVVPYTNTLYDANTVFVSDENGRITESGATYPGIRGLDAGVYYLVETQAPAGYIKAQNGVKIEITATTKTTEHTQYYNSNTGEISDTNATGLTPVTWSVTELATYKVEINGKETASYTMTNEEEPNKGDTVTGAHGAIGDPSNSDPLADAGKITNTQGVELPSTGGMGTTILYIGGSILVILAAVLLITKRRMNAED